MGLFRKLCVSACYCFESLDVSVVSFSLRYQKAAEDLSAEKKKGVSTSLNRWIVATFHFPVTSV